MSGIYYTDLDAALQAAGLEVVENYINAGWQERARGSGGFPAAPLAVVWHHTASDTTPENDLAWMIDGSDDAPIGNLLIDRDGICWPIAAGASNCAGKGGPAAFSRGTIPLDQGNTRAFNIEVANDGLGEPWPAAQIDAYFLASNALNALAGNRPDDVITHGGPAGWAPDRKIDPATAAAVQGSWRPSSSSSSGTWQLAEIQAECSARAGTTPTPPTPTPTPPEPGTPAPPPTLEDNMIVAIDANGTAWIGDGLHRYAPTESDFNVKVLLAGDDALRLVNTKGERVNGWGNVHTVDANVIEALGRPG